MSISEIFYKCRADSIKNFIPATKIKTKKDIDEYNAKGFLIGYTADEFRETFPKIPIDKIFYNDGFDKVYYYDASKFIVFQINMFGREVMSLSGDFQTEILEAIAKRERAYENKEYHNLIMWLNDIMKFEMFTGIISAVDFPNAYKFFLDIYTTSEYGFNLLTDEFIKKISSYKTNEDKKATAKKLSSYHKEIFIYRGEGEKSQSYTNAFSWTTDINVANFFAIKMGSRNARIISAKVKKEDVFEVGRKDEKELIILPGKVYDIEITNIYDLSDFENIYLHIDYNYKKYRGVIDKIGYNSGIHGITHIYRVLLNALILAYYHNIDDEDIKILATACAWHDAARTHDGTDDFHGLYGAEKYKEMTSKYNPDTYFLIKNHSVDDEVALEELNRIYKTPKERERMQLLFKIIKDSDALDRVRLGRWDMDINFLRLRDSKRMTLLAKLIYENIK